MNVIEALAVTIGLDASLFKQGAKDVDKSLKDTESNADRAAKEMQAKGKVAAEFFGKIRNQVIALAATFTAGAGLKSFIENVTTADAAVGRTARNIGVSTELLTAWQGVAERAGGSASGIAGSMQGLSQQFQQLALTGQSAVVPYFRAVGVALADANGKMRPMGDLLLDLSDKFSKMDPQRAQALGRGMGLDEGTINVLMQGRSAIQALLAEQQKLGAANKADADAAAKRQAQYRALTQASEDLGRKLLTAITPALSAVLKGLTALAGWLAAHPNVFGAFVAAAAIAATALTVALNVLAFRGFMGLVAAMFKVPAAAAAAAEGMEAAGTAAVASSAKVGTGILGMLGSLAKGAALVAVAGAVGYAIGTAIYAAIEDTKFADKLGRYIAKTLAFFGNEDAKAALEAEERASKAPRVASGKVTAPAQPVAPPLASNAPAAAVQREQAQRDIDKLVGMGWTRAQATGIAANIQRESAGNEKAIGDQGNAFGLAQWHRDRQINFEKWAGKNIRQASRDEQLAFINFELRQGTEQKAGRALMQTNDPGQAAAVISSQYERPADREGEASKRAGLAVSLLRGAAPDPALQIGAAAVAASHTTNNATANNSHAETHIGTVNIQTAATDAEGIAGGIRPAIEKSFSTAAQANYGLT